jgi:hypothetical protein
VDEEPTMQLFDLLRCAEILDPLDDAFEGLLEAGCVGLALLR